MRSLFLSFLVLASVAATAQSARYVDVMKKNIAQMDSSKTVQDFQTLANNFERIGDAEKNQWLPYYYAGLNLTRIGWIEDPKIDRDANALRILALCDKAEAIEKNAEIYTIRNMASTQQMMVDPQTRWSSYGVEATKAREAGLKIDPNNPRLYYLEGMSIFNTPATFGGGKDKAKPIFVKAVALYQQEQVKPLYPNWGKKEAEEMLAKCQ